MVKGGAGGREGWLREMLLEGRERRLRELFWGKGRVIEGGKGGLRCVSGEYVTRRLVEGSGSTASVG